MLSLTLIDDFGLKPLRPPQYQDFRELMAERSEQAATLLTGNFDFSEWGDVSSTNKMLGTAILDRVRHGAYRVILNGDSYRAPRPLPVPTQPAPCQWSENPAVLTLVRAAFICSFGSCH